MWQNLMWRGRPRPRKPARAFALAFDLLLCSPGTHVPGYLYAAPFGAGAICQTDRYCQTLVIPNRISGEESALLQTPLGQACPSHTIYTFAAVSIGVVSSAIPGPIVELK
jgi:hypothetical protein